MPAIDPIVKNVSPELMSALEKALRATLIPELSSDAWTLNIVREVSWDKRLKVCIVLPTFGLKSEKNIALAVKKALIQHVEDPEKIDLFVYSDVKPAAVQSIKKEEIADVRNVILVASGKGGVGKSTVASNLAVTMAQLGCRVGLLDADVYGPSVPVMFDLEEEGQVKAFKEPNSDATFMVPPIKYDVALMSLGFLVDTDAPMIWRGPMIASASMQMFHNVYWGQLDYLIVDLPPGTGDIQLTIAQKINVAGAVIVSTPQDVALKDVIRAKNMFDKVNIPILGLIENMSYFVCDSCDKHHQIFSQGGAIKQAQDLGIKVLGELPLTPALRTAADKGEPLAFKDKTSPISEQLREVAHEICASVALMGMREKLPDNSAQNNPQKANQAEEKKRRLPVL
ncbi:MAG: Mrp/NBP35 family ATP-binding protein [Myxococcales bacterium]|nr:Mrp/NBP35 family ATP-binding protein [Myxococcales bacterium]USN51567.1 MAG: Mrp/NBP35 family ATP-binding protein [Myxococcales bacterium]